MINKCLNMKLRRRKGQVYCYCAKTRAVIDFNTCLGCVNKEYKKTPKTAFKIENKTCPKLKQKTPLNKISKTNKVTKATAIPKKVKLKVWERDNKMCIFCHELVSWNYANSHFIKRSHLGLGIEENIFTACLTCHHDFDDTPKRVYMLPIAKRYLMNKYDYWNEEMLVYKKWGN